MERKEGVTGEVVLLGGDGTPLTSCSLEASGEGAASLYLRRHGFFVYRSETPDGPFDLLAAKNGDVFRFEVRTGRRDGNGEIQFGTHNVRAENMVIVIHGKGGTEVILYPGEPVPVSMNLADGKQVKNIFSSSGGRYYKLKRIRSIFGEEFSNVAENPNRLRRMDGLFHLLGNKELNSDELIAERDRLCLSEFTNLDNSVYSYVFVVPYENKKSKTKTRYKFYNSGTIKEFLDYMGTPCASSGLAVEVESDFADCTPKQKAASFTGHRPQRLGSFDSNYPKNVKIREFIRRSIENLRAEGFSEFISGEALGVDQWAAEMVLELELRLTIVLPFKNYGENWLDENREKLAALRASANRVIVVCEGGYFDEAGKAQPWKMKRRNDWMKDNSECIVAVWDGKPDGGTFAAVESAIKSGKRVIRYNPDTEREEPI